MRAVVQRVTQARVLVDEQLAGGERPGVRYTVVGEIEAGLLVLVGVATEDTEKDADWLADKVANLRIFEDAEGKMNFSVLDRRGGVLSVSQFTLLGDARRGRRPEFTRAARPEVAEPLYKRFCNRLSELGVPRVASGVFREHMQVELVNDGPVTIIIETPS